MRTMILAAGLIALMAVTPAIAAQAVSGNPAQSQTTKKVKSKVKGATTGGVGATTGTIATELTAQECTDLGGTVFEGGGFCKGDKYCGTTDQDGKRHRVCLEVAQ